MGQKIHPLLFRVDITQKSQSQWFAKPSQYSLLVLEDQFIRNYCFKRFALARISNIKITRRVSTNRIAIKIITPETSPYDDKDKQKIKKIKKECLSELKNFRAENFPLAVSSNNFKKIEKQIMPGTDQSLSFSIETEKSRKKYRLASFFADFLVLQFEKRVRFRKALAKVMQSYRRARRHNVEGIKIQISGRINGAEIARTEWIQKGRVPLHTLEADIDYSYKFAKTIYGLLGIKIWVFRGKDPSKKSTKMRILFPIIRPKNRPKKKAKKRRKKEPVIETN